MSAVKLNGWQRLWVVCSVIYLALVMFIAAAEYPSAEDARHFDEDHIGFLFFTNVSYVNKR